MNTDDILVFTTAAASGNLSEAARGLGLSPMAASRRLAALEADLGVRLMHRTTRSLSLTAEGEAFLPHALALTEHTALAQAEMRGDREAAAGLLRVSLPVAFARKIVAPLVPGLLDAHPELQISLQMSDAMPDLVAAGLDLAIRIARLKDSSFVARKLADNPRLLVASPAYVARAGMPATRADLASHQTLPMAGVSHWTLIDDTQAVNVRVQSRFSASSIEGCHAACLAGGGIALLSAWNVADDIAAGRLVPVELKDGRPELLAVWALYPSARMVLPKVRVFIDAIRKSLAESS
jgi:DNA-binding transcriptional LysR family regulator